MRHSRLQSVLGRNNDRNFFLHKSPNCYMGSCQFKGA